VTNDTGDYGGIDRLADVAHGTPPEQFFAEPRAVRA